MNNHDDFWTGLAAGHSNTTLSAAMDSHLSGKSIGESFGSVATLTDKHRQANALSLPVEAGTKVVFAGGLGAHLSYDDVPADGITGEVVKVKSATGEITHHDGKVFVKWADGKFRPIHAEHLRLAGLDKSAARELNPHARRMTFDDFKKGYFKGETVPNSIAKEFWDDFKYAHVGSLRSYIKATSDKTAADKSAASRPNPGDTFEATSNYLDIVGMGQYNSSMRMTFFVNPDGSASAIYGGKVQTEKSEQLSAKDVDDLFRKGSSRGLNMNTSFTDPKITKRGRRAGSLDAILKEMDLPEMRRDTSSLANVRWLMRNMGVKNKDHPKYGEAKKALKALHRSLGKRASVIRVASLGDLTQFLKRADGKLVHKSTNDLWSYSKDADGNFLVERLFDDEGEPLQG